MQVVINDFEAIAETKEPSSRASKEAEEEKRPKPDLKAQDVEPALRDLARRARRSWAH